MTALTFRVVRDGVPQVGGVFADVFAAMDHGRREYEYDVYEPMEDLDYLSPTFSWQMGWQANGTDRCLWLYDGDQRTGVHIDPVTLPEIDIQKSVVLTPHECPLCSDDLMSVPE